MVSQHALQQVSEGMVSQHALQVSRLTPREEVWSGQRGSPGPQPRGKLRGLAWGVSTPTPEGCLQAHTQGVFPGLHPGTSPGPHPGRSPGPHPWVTPGGLQAHTQEGVSQHALRHTPKGYCCRWYPTGLHSCYTKVGNVIIFVLLYSEE